MNKKPFCPKCGSEDLKYYETRERRFEVDEDLNLTEISNYPFLRGDILETIQVECSERHLNSNDDAELKKLATAILDRNDRLNS